MNSELVHKIYKWLGREFYEKLETENNTYKDTRCTQNKEVLAETSDSFETEEDTRRIVKNMDPFELIGDTFDNINLLMTEKDPDEKEPRLSKWRNLDPWDWRNPEIYQKYKEQFNSQIEHKKDIAKSVIKLKYNFENTFWKYLNYKQIKIVNDAIGVPITLTNPLLLNSRKPEWRKEDQKFKLETRDKNGYDVREMKRNIKGHVGNPDESGLIVIVREELQDKVIEFRDYVKTLFIQVSQFKSRLIGHVKVLKDYMAEKLDKYWLDTYKKKKY